MYYKTFCHNEKQNRNLHREVIVFEIQNTDFYLPVRLVEHEV